MKNKGFTLIELLVVIVILSTLLIFAISSIGNIMSSSRQNIYSKNEKALKEACEQLVIDVDDYYSPIFNCNSDSWLAENNHCKKENNKWSKITIKVQDLIANKYFQDSQGACKNEEITITKDDKKNIRIDIPTGICEK